MKDGKFDGKWTSWYEDGQIERVWYFKDGNPARKSTFWNYENGQKEFETIYKDGELDSRWSWYENGQKKSEENYKDGKLDGKWTRWDENGQIELEATFKDGE